MDDDTKYLLGNLDRLNCWQCPRFRIYPHTCDDVLYDGICVLGENFAPKHNLSSACKFFFLPYIGLGRRDDV